MLGASSYPRRGRYGISTAPAATTAATGTGSSNTFLVRPRLPLRSYARPKTAANILGVDPAPGYGRSKRLKSRKLNGYQKVETTGKKKAPDYTDFAYREAVSKLKYLLAESYTPRITPRKLLHGGGGRFNNSGDSNPKLNAESGEETDDRSVTSEISQSKPAGMVGNLQPRSSPYLPRPKNSQLSRGCSNLALLSSRDPQSAPPELISFIERQEEYIEQLERESQYCRDELTNLLGKVREVVAENETLHDKNKNGFLNSVIEEYDNNSEGENRQPNSQSLNSTLESKGKRVKLQKILEGPSIVFESRISELEAQLTQARVELRKVQEENQANLRRLSESGGGDALPELKTQVERALRDKREAEMKLEEVQRSLSAVRDREADAAHKAKRTLDLLEQAQFEKTQAEGEMRRLRDELDRQHERLREASQEAGRRLAEERHQIERRYSQQVEQLTADVASHWDVASKSQLEAEKQRREMSDLRRDLAQKQALIDELKKELQSKISAMQSDLSQAVAEKDAAEQEISASKLAAERAERQARQEQNRLQSEINSYKQRLERADADLVHCRRENLRLAEQIASLEKEVNINKMINSEEHRTPGATPRGGVVDNDKELTSMIMDIETKHEGIVESDEPAIAITSGGSPPARKKRTVKVDLKVKVIPKKKSARSDTAKPPLSAQEEMASLQDNLKYLTSQIQDSLVHQNDNPSYETTSRMNETGRDGGDLNLSSEKLAVELARDPTKEIKGDSSKSITETASSNNGGELDKDGLLDQRERVLKQDLNRTRENDKETRESYVPDQPVQHYTAVESPRYNADPVVGESDDKELDMGYNNQPGNTTDSDYKMENYNPLADNQNYNDPQYADQSYDQYNQYNQEQYPDQEQYQNQEHYDQEGVAGTGQYGNEEMYQNREYNEQEYQNYPSEYEGSELQQGMQPEPLITDEHVEPTAFEEPKLTDKAGVEQ